MMTWNTEYQYYYEEKQFQIFNSIRKFANEVYNRTELYFLKRKNEFSTEFLFFNSKNSQRCDKVETFSVA